MKNSILLGISLVLLGKLAFMMPLSTHYAAAFFYPAGIAVAIVFLAGWRMLPLVLFSALVLNIWLINDFTLSAAAAALGISLAFTLQTWISACVFFKLFKFPLRFDNQREISLFVLLSPVLCLIHATWVVAILGFLHLIPTDELSNNWLTIWLGNTIGLLVLFPCTMAFFAQPHELWKPRKFTVALPILSTTLLLVTIYWYKNNEQYQYSKQTFQSNAQLFAAQLQVQLNRYEAIPQMLEAQLFDDTPNRERFKQITTQILANAPSTQMIAWAPHISDTQRAVFEKSQQAELTGFEISDLITGQQLSRAVQRKEYYPISFVESKVSHHTMNGLDLFSIIASADLQKILRSGQSITAHTSQLGILHNTPSSILLLHRISRGPYAPSIIVTETNMADLVKSVWHTQAHTTELTLTDVSLKKQILGKKPPHHQEMQFSHILKYGGQEYLLSVYPNTQYRAQNHVYGWLFLALTEIIISILCGVLLYLTKTHRTNTPAPIENITLAAKLQDYYHLLDISPHAMLLIDHSEHITHANPATNMLFGYNNNELIGKSIELLLPKKQEKSCLQLQEGYIQGRKKDGVLFDIAITVTADLPMQYLISIADVSSPKKIEEELREHRDNLDSLVEQHVSELIIINTEANRQAKIKSDFLANMSHEIRTPLNAVLGMVQIGLRGEHDEKSRRLFQQIFESGELLLGIVNDILDFSKIEAGKLVIEIEAFSLMRIVTYLQTTMSERASSKGITLHIEKDQDTPEWVEGDFMRISQILLNLLSNAIKFTTTGEVSLVITQKKHNIVFRVTDSGIGMNEDQLSRLFNAFEQAEISTARKFGGTGLGLAISKRLATLMDGDIYVSSTPNIGSIFELTLPLNIIQTPQNIPSDTNNEHTKQSVISGPRLAGYHILVAEDNLVNQTVLAEMLKLEHASLVCVDDGLQALDLLKQEGDGAFDLMFTDIQMPYLDGYQLTQQLRPLYPNLPIIGLTACAMTEEKERCFSCGMQGYLSKPLNLELLVSTILTYARVHTLAIQEDMTHHKI